MPQRARIAAVSLSLFAAHTFAQPEKVSTAEVMEAVDEFSAEFSAAVARGDSSVESVNTIYAEILGSFPVENMTSRQLATLPDMFFQFGDSMSRGLDRLHELAETDTQDLYAAARIVSLSVLAKASGMGNAVRTDSDGLRELIRRVVNHPDLVEAVRSGGAFSVGRDTLLLLDGAEERDALVRLAGLMTDEDADAKTVVEFTRRWDKIRETDIEQNELVRMREALIPALQRATLTLQIAEGDNSWYIETAQGTLSMLSNASSLGELVGGPAPALEFVWSTDPSIRSLEDLRGHVVLLEFWVTGCGHCTASIPQMRELADRYAGTDVTILGVTSVQGRHFDPESGQYLDVRGDQTREFELMADFVRANGMTWDNAFSSITAWNPAYGVQGTPHLTLIDPEGNVAANDMHPYDGLEANAARIDGVLERFGLPVPD